MNPHDLPSESNPPVPLNSDDLVELHRLVPPVYAAHGHACSPQQAVNRYLAYVAEGLDDVNRFLAGRPERCES